MSNPTLTSKGLLCLALLLAGCRDEPYCDYYESAIREAKDYRTCLRSGECKLTGEEYSQMQERERRCPWKFEGSKNE